MHHRESVKRGMGYSDRMCEVVELKEPGNISVRIQVTPENCSGPANSAGWGPAPLPLKYSGPAGLGTNFPGAGVSHPLHP